MHDFKRLDVWKKAIELATDIYQITAKFPNEELYGLTSQMRRSAVSVGSNISEGAGRGSDMEFCQFLNYSYGSTCELYTQLLISLELNFIQKNEYEQIKNKNSDIQKMIYKLSKKLKK